MNMQQANLDSPLQSKHKTKYKVTDKINCVGKLESVKKFQQRCEYQFTKKKIKAKYNKCVPIV